VTDHLIFAAKKCIHLFIPDINFTSILRAAFSTVLFLHSQSVIREKLRKFQQHFTSSFFVQNVLPSFNVLLVWVCYFCKKKIGAKAAN